MHRFSISNNLACRRGLSGSIDRTGSLDRCSRNRPFGRLHYNLNPSSFTTSSPLPSSSQCLLLLHNTLTSSRAEKLEDARAKAAIKAQIEADKKARAEKAARDKAIRDGQPVPDTLHASPAPQVGTNAVKAAAATAGMKGKDFPETRLQVRLSTGGAPLVKSFKSDAREYRLWVVVGVLGFRDADVGVLGAQWWRRAEQSAVPRVFCAFNGEGRNQRREFLGHVDRRSDGERRGGADVYPSTRTRSVLCGQSDLRTGRTRARNGERRRRIQPLCGGTRSR